MKKCILLLTIFATLTTFVFGQKVGFINTQMIRDRLPDAKLANQRVQSMVDEWNRELKSMEDKESALQFEVRKNRLIWSDAEKITRDKELADLQADRIKYSTDKYAPGGGYDKVAKEILTPVEEKIFAAVQEVASKLKYDFIWDQSTQPLAYVNFKYDITLKVLKLLGVDVTAEEKEQEDKITKDPRNDDDKNRETTGTRRRSRTATNEPTDKPLEQNGKELKQPEPVKLESPKK